MDPTLLRIYSTSQMESEMIFPLEKTTEGFNSFFSDIMCGASYKGFERLEKNCTLYKSLQWPKSIFPRQQKNKKVSLELLTGNIKLQLDIIYRSIITLCNYNILIRTNPNTEIWRFNLWPKKRLIKHITM